MSKVIGITVGTTYDKKKISGSGLTEEQIALLERIAKDYADRDYTKMTVKMTPSGGTYELGSSEDITFSWEFTQDVSSVTFNGNKQEPAEKKGSKKVEGITSSSSYEVIGIRADGNQEKASAKSDINFLNRFYRGYAEIPADNKIDGEFIKKLGTMGYATSRSYNCRVKCPNLDDYFWYAYPARFGAAQVTLGDYGRGGCVLYDEPVYVTNKSGYTEKYLVYRSTESGIGYHYEDGQPFKAT